MPSRKAVRGSERLGMETVMALAMEGALRIKMALFALRSACRSSVRNLTTERISMKVI